MSSFNEALVYYLHRFLLPYDDYQVHLILFLFNHESLVFLLHIQLNQDFFIHFILLLISDVIDCFIPFLLIRNVIRCDLQSYYLIPLIN